MTSPAHRLGRIPRAVFGAVSIALIALVSLALPAATAGASPGEPSGPWTIVPSPNGSGAVFSTLESVSCPTASDCVAVGAAYSAATGTGQDPTVPLAEVSHGTTWTVSSVPEPAGAGWAQLRSVSCPAATTCMAVGSAYVTSLAHQVPFSVTWDGLSWALVTVPVSAATFTAVSCPTPSFCMATGTAIGSSATIVTPPTSATWNGHTWTVHPVALQAGDSYANLWSVSCSSGTFCMGVGFTGGPHVSQVGLQEVWNGATWTPTAIAPVGGVPAPGTTGVIFNSVSCPAATWCMGVGAYSANQIVAFSEIYTATGWGTVGNAGGSAILNGVTCTSTTDCEVVGAVGGHAVILPWTNATWTYLNGPSLQSPHGLTAVSCRSGHACVAVGSYGTYAGSNTLVEAPGVHLTSPGYRLVASDGGVFAFTAPFHGSMGGRHLNAPVVGMATDPLTGGYWLVASDGGVFAFTAPFLGSMGGRHLNAPIVGIAAASTGSGYWLVASDGGVFAFGAPYHGSMGGKSLAAPVAGIAAAPTGSGYWLVAKDGGVFAFTAPFTGSRATGPVLGPMVGMAGDPTVGGYRITTTHGTITEAGQQADFGTLAGLTLAAPVVGIVDDPGTDGYWMIASDGGVFAFNAPYDGSMGGSHLVAPIVGGAAA